MPYYRVPMLIDVFRLTGETDAETESNVTRHLAKKPGGHSHQRSVTFLKAAYSNAHLRTQKLIADCRGNGTIVGANDNAKIVESVLPKIIGRKIQAFDFGKRQYQISPDLFSTIGPSFFIVENDTIKMVYFHSRNDNRASISDLAGLAWAIDEEILKTDFFGQRADVEIHYVDKIGSRRSDTLYNLESLRPYLKEEPIVILDRFARAFRKVDENRLAGELKKREQKRGDFDDGQIVMDI
ncbi:hypothetical protein [Brucella grignonensis]|uniref:hypothetical protein n=1 Tax=Brucella grignonensis TaxID=94627 RepID=UPI0011404486|nr:hypothetical protein [Brucella grignonensis]